ncbi:AAA family ATPase [Agrobacterium vitis]|uniref:AAA family ATPase n=1 Tax=Agrobacterium vitis TaxID=373 RepID=A0AAE4WEJ4_AGRVI|nr:AAA family ATPase [Agrobacterium vitis]MCF1499042.1 AAA family ATPase [Allorhizobium sp. Av2]MCM2441051.1 AAA family ATPase [Agrobacterium vitis]MUZ58490.1 AAA family ATPase [Agrobacterium vitis]MVA65816.1 AAA family ATPase [Agrobacterium vitis]MVA88162.1 AAA family ATPase [Agrobacterium vitis]
MIPVPTDMVFETPEDRERASRLPIPTRQHLIKYLRIPYRTYNLGLAMIATLHRPADHGTPNLGVVGGLLGESGSGKTVICEAYANRYPPRDGDVGMEFPVLHISASLGMNRERLGNKIKRATSSPHRILSREDPFDWSVERVLKCKTEHLILDDAQFMFFNQRSSQLAAEMYGFVKDVVDTRMVTILLVGEPDIDKFVYDIPAFVRRAYRSETLKPLTSSPQELEFFGDVLRSIDKRLPFSAPSRLENYREHFHRYSGGQIGRVMNIVEAAGYLALNDLSACILVEHLREAVRTRIRPGDDIDYFGYKAGRN